MLLDSYDALVAALVADDVTHEAMPESSRVLMPVDFEGLKSTGILVWFKDVALVQFVLPLPWQVPEDRLSEIAEAALRLNHELIVPGFQLDYANRQVYFRLTQPRRPDGQIDKADVQRLVATAIQTSARFEPVLGLVAEGALPGAKVVED